MQLHGSIFASSGSFADICVFPHILPQPQPIPDNTPYTTQNVLMECHDIMAYHDTVTGYGWLWYDDMS